MKKIKTANATESQINWLVSKIMGEDYSPVPTTNGIGMEFPATNFTGDWGQAGPVIDRFELENSHGIDSYVGYTNKYWWREADGGTDERKEFAAEGDTKLCAMMRVLIKAWYPQEVEVPEELK